MRKLLPVRSFIVLMASLALLFAGCSGQNSTDQTLLLWHDWPAADAAVLNSSLAKFESLNPDINVVAKFVPQGDFVARFVDQMDLGLGPELILTNAGNLQGLYERGYIQRDLHTLGITSEDIYGPALTAYVDGENLFALPVSKSTQLMFFDKRAVTTPPTTLRALADEAIAQDYRLGLNTSFMESYWGVQAYGGSLRNSEGQIALNNGGLANWLTALQYTQASAAFLLSNDQNQLRQQFLDGTINLYIGSSNEFNQLQEALGPENLGVAVLPGGRFAGRPAGPILESSALAISGLATPEEIDAAVRLAQFVTSARQQTSLTTGQLGRLPANSTIRVSPAMPEITRTLAAQTRTAVPLRYDDRVIWDTLRSFGADVYLRVLAGDVDVIQAVDELTMQVSVLEGTPVQLAEEVICPANPPSEPVTLWYGWSEAESAALRIALAYFEESCPDVDIELTRIEGNVDLFERYSAAVEAGAGPDILFDSTQWLALYATANHIYNLSQDIDPTALARFVPQAQANVRFSEQLFAIPLTARSVALYYNTDLVTDPPVTMDELLFRIDTEHRIVMPLTFFYAYFGIEAFGATLFDGTNVVLDEGAGMVRWLEWLRTASAHAGMIYTDDRESAEELFAAGETAFMVGLPTSLNALRRQLSADQLRVAPLPAGPVALAAPILETEGVMFNPAIERDALNTGIALANFLTSARGVQTLVQSGQYVPANVDVELNDFPVIAGFRDAAQTAEVVSQGPEWEAVFEFGDAMYVDAVRNGVDPTEAVRTFVDDVNEANQTVANTELPAASGTAAPEASPPQTDEEPPATAEPPAMPAAEPAATPAATAAEELP